MQDISFIQGELAKLDRYIWGRKQDDRWDSLSRFVYRIATYDQMTEKAHLVAVKHNMQIQAFVGYCLTRWFNFWSTKVVEDLFCQHPDVVRKANLRHKEIDFYIRGIPFDHKTSVFPRQYGKNFDFAVANRGSDLEANGQTLTREIILLK